MSTCQHPSMVDLPPKCRTVEECVIHARNPRPGMRIVDHFFGEPAADGTLHLWPVWELTQVGAAKAIGRANGDRFVTLDVFQPRPRELLANGRNRAWRTNEAIFQGAHWSEADGPPHVDCPLGLLAIAGKPPATWPNAVAWRTALWTHHTKGAR